MCVQQNCSDETPRVMTDNNSYMIPRDSHPDWSESMMDATGRVDLSSPTTDMSSSDHSRDLLRGTLLDYACTETSSSLASEAQGQGVAEDEEQPAKKKAKRRRTKPKYKINHDYHDYATATYQDFLAANPNHKPARELKAHLSFPKALHAMLDLVSTDDQEDIVSWCSHGRAFIVHKPEDFVETILPIHLSQTKFTSFQRQLNIYGFRRLTTGRDSGAYYHELFLRGRVDLCPAMVRTKIKGTRHKGANNPEDEPNFGSYPPPHKDKKIREEYSNSVCDDDGGDEEEEEKEEVEQEKEEEKEEVEQEKEDSRADSVPFVTPSNSSRPSKVLASHAVESFSESSVASFPVPPPIYSASQAHVTEPQNLNVSPARTETAPAFEYIHPTIHHQSHAASYSVPCMYSYPQVASQTGVHSSGAWRTTVPP